MEGQRGTETAPYIGEEKSGSGDIGSISEMTLKRTQILFPSERVEKVVSEAKQEYSSVLKDFYTRRNEGPVHMQNFRALLARKKLIDRIPEFLARGKIVIREDRFYEFERELPDLVLFSYTGIIEYVLDVLELFGKGGNVEEAKELIKNYEGSGDNYEGTENLDIKKAYIFRYIRVFAENSDAVNFAVEELDKLFVPSFIKSF